MEKLVVALLVCPCHPQVTVAVPPVPDDISWNDGTGAGHDYYLINPGKATASDAYQMSQFWYNSADTSYDNGTLQAQTMASGGWAVGESGVTECRYSTGGAYSTTAWTITTAASDCTTASDHMVAALQGLQPTVRNS